jgi:hypothetical protein
MLPISAALVGVLALGETLGGLQLVAFAMALLGVLLATMPTRVGPIRVKKIKKSALSMASPTNHFLPIATVLILALTGGCSRSISSANLEKNTRATRGNMAPASLAGCQLKYSDNHGRNIYTFLNCFY